MNILQEFIDDVEAVGPEDIREDWPNLYATFRKAKDRMAATTQAYVVVHQWYIEGDEDNVVEVLAMRGDRESALSAAQEAAKSIFASLTQAQTIAEDAGRVVATEVDGQTAAFRILDGDWCDSVVFIQAVKDCDFP